MREGGGFISEAICSSAGSAGESRLADTGRRLQSSIHPEKKKKRRGPLSVQMVAGGK